MPESKPAAREEIVRPRSLDQSSRVRWVILGLLFSITVINFIDRQTLSVLAPVIESSYHLSTEAYGRIVAALQFGMMTGEFPMGWLMDRIGARIGLVGAVLWWSAATATQVFTRNGVELGATRLWMGTGEAGNYSGGMKAVSRFFAQEERTLAIGIFNSGSMIGATVAPPLVIFLMLHYGFRSAFLVPAALGLIWAPLWWIFYPRHKASDSKVEAQQTPLSDILRNSSSWAVMMCRFFIGPVMQFYWYWIPSYLYSARHLSIAQIGFLAWIPFFLGDTGGVLGGWAAGWLQKRNLKIYRVRQITMYSSAVLCMCSLAVPVISDAATALVVIGIAILADNFLSANMYGAITDLFPDQAVGRATGLTGVSGGLSGLLFPLLTGVLVQRISFKPVFVLVAFMPLLGTLALFILGKQYRAPDSLREATNQA